MNPLIVLAVALIAFATALFTTPYVRRLALNVGMLDATGERRMHDQPKPRIGGIAVYLGFAFALFSAIGYLISTGQIAHPGHVREDLGNLHDVIGLIFGGTLVLMVGIWDDVMTMQPRAKLLAQALVAGISMLYGFQIHYITNPLHPGGPPIYFPEGVTLALTLLWYLGMMNAINFIDGLDGLLSGLTVISAVSLIAIDLMRGHAEIALIL
ncbi:MAG TPA: MraY family glycosyltransferase, partial [Candidatus Elarobacter sp.]